MEGAGLKRHQPHFDGDDFCCYLMECGSMVVLNTVDHFTIRVILANCASQNVLKYLQVLFVLC